MCTDIISVKKDIVCVSLPYRGSGKKQRANNSELFSLLSSLWHGTLPECYSGHHVAHAEHGQTGQHEVGLLFW